MGGSTNNAPAPAPSQRLQAHRKEDTGQYEYTKTWATQLTIPLVQELVVFAEGTNASGLFCPLVIIFLKGGGDSQPFPLAVCWAGAMTMAMTMTF